MLSKHAVKALAWVQHPYSGKFIFRRKLRGTPVAHLIYGELRHRPEVGSDGTSDLLA